MMLRSTMAAAALVSALQVATASGALALAQIDIVVGDGSNEGFNDPTAVAALPGNPAIKRGAQRLAVFRAAADAWENMLDSAVPIRVRAVMDPLTPCTPTAGVLGRAGTLTVLRDFPGAPRANTWYPSALANRLAGSDQDTSEDDIGASFNSDVDNNPNCLSTLDWWYGIGAPAPAGTISFFDTLLHELGHGLGFQSFVRVQTGAKLQSEDGIPHDDIYMSFLEDHSSGTAWPGMTDAQRMASATDTGDLHWSGSNVNSCAVQILSGGLASGHARMYAPNPVAPGSSVSHFDTALTPDELMEPFATASSDQRLTNELLRDIGWNVNSPPCEAETDSSALRDAVTVAAIRAHHKALQEIADANDGVRVSGGPGYDASVRYVEQKLRDAGYQVVVQPFQFPFYEEPSPSEVARLDPEPKTYVHDTDFVTLRYSGSGTVEGVVVPTSDIVIPPTAVPSSTSGCEFADFPAAPAGPAVALVQRGDCTFAQKVANAAAAGYEAIVIFNEGQEGRQEVLRGTLGAPVAIPVLGASFALGEELHRLAQRGEVRVRVRTDTTSENRETANVIGETGGGAADRVVVVGAHLDSVPDGEGINDNGSGAATVLEIAIQMSKLGIAPGNKVRFAFWGAEEWGLLGSGHHVSQLSEGELGAILLNLNFDMLGSPNPVRFVYDGDGSSTPQPGPPGSAEIEGVFLDYFRDQDLPVLPTAFDGRSDYGPFIAQGIAAGGLFSGAEGLKTPEQAQVFGGTAGQAYDRCYHQPCDDFANNDDRSLDELSDAAAHATLHFATVPPAAVVAARAAGVELAAAGVSLEALPFRGEAQLQK